MLDGLIMDWLMESRRMTIPRNLKYLIVMHWLDKTRFKLAVKRGLCGFGGMGAPVGVPIIVARHG